MPTAKGVSGPSVSRATGQPEAVSSWHWGWRQGRL